MLPTLRLEEDGTISTDTVGYSSTRELLNEFQGELVRSGGPVHLMRPGLPRPQIEVALKSAGLSAPDELVAWFEWHDGYDPDPSAPYTSNPLPFVYPTTLDDAISRYEGPKANGRSWAWAPGWIKLGSDPTSLAVDTSAGGDAPVTIARPREDRDLGEERLDIPHMRSLCTLLAIYIDGLRRGELFWTGLDWGYQPDVNSLGSQFGYV